MKRHQPALLGGLFIGVLSSLPTVSAANLCCCLWVVTGGLLTVYLQQQAKADPLETSEAVLGGLLAGVIGAVIACIGTAIMLSVTGPVIQQAIQRGLDSGAEIPPEVRDMILKYATGPSLVLLMAAINLPTYAVFSMLGALLGLTFFRKKLPPVAAPPPPVPPTFST
jgi:hypothetical protein